MKTWVDCLRKNFNFLISRANNETQNFSLSYLLIKKQKTSIKTIDSIKKFEKKLLLREISSKKCISRSYYQFHNLWFWDVILTWFKNDQIFRASKVRFSYHKKTNSNAGDFLPSIKESNLPYATRGRKSLKMQISVSWSNVRFLN